MLAQLQAELTEKTDGAAIASVPETPSLTQEEVDIFVAEVTKKLKEAVGQGKSSFDFVFATRSRLGSVPWDQFWTADVMEETDRYRKPITPDPALPAAFVSWWRNLKKTLGYRSLPDSTFKIALKRREDLLFDYLDKLVRAWSQKSDVPARVLRTVKSEYHDGSRCYPREISYTKHTESVGITFDWTPTTDPEIVAARARVTRCEGKLSEARNHLNRLMAASLESPTKRARTNQ
jgi:hypothetical protein